MLGISETELNSQKCMAQMAGKTACPMLAFSTLNTPIEIYTYSKLRHNMWHIT